MQRAVANLTAKKFENKRFRALCYHGVPSLLHGPDWALHAGFRDPKDLTARTLLFGDANGPWATDAADQKNKAAALLELLRDVMPVWHDLHVMVHCVAV